MARSGRRWLTEQRPGGGYEGGLRPGEAIGFVLPVRRGEVRIMVTTAPCHRPATPRCKTPWTIPCSSPACSTSCGLAGKMLRRYPKVHRWEETDDVFVEAAAMLRRAMETVQPESPRHFYNLAATQIRRVLINLS